MKILVVFTGGTIGSVNNNGVISPDSSARYKLIEMYRQNGGKAELDSVSPYTILSENMTGEYFSLLYNSVKENIKKNYDGIIVTHGTDTLQYTSAMLSYMLGLCKIPVVLVSANYPLDNSKSNGVENFKSAVDFIASGEHKGVFTAYKNNGEAPKIHRASRLQNHLAYDDRLYSVHNMFYGEITDNGFVRNPDYKEKADELSLEHIPTLTANSSVLRISPYVGITYPPIDKNTKAVLLESYHSGTVNTVSTELKSFCKAAENSDIPIFLTGSEAGFFYESKKLYAELGIKILPPVAPISAYIKLWLLCECGYTKDLYNAFSKSLGGDIL